MNETRAQTKTVKNSKGTDIVKLYFTNKTSTNKSAI